MSASLLSLTLLPNFGIFHSAVLVNCDLFLLLCLQNPFNWIFSFHKSCPRKSLVQPTIGPKCVTVAWCTVRSVQALAMLNTSLPKITVPRKWKALQLRPHAGIGKSLHLSSYQRLDTSLSPVWKRRGKSIQDLVKSNPSMHAGSQSLNRSVGERLKLQ